MMTKTDSRFPLSRELILLSHIHLFGLTMSYNKIIANFQKHQADIESGMQPTAQYIFP